MSLIDLVFPKKCLECGTGGKYICNPCLVKVRPGTRAKDNISIFKYEGVIRKAIITLKYKYSLDVAVELAEAGIKNLPKAGFSQKAVLVPIPLHWYKRNIRGFNQSEEVGKILASKMGWGFLPDLLIKRKSTKAQVELRGVDRRSNLKNTFEINPKYKIPGSIIVFDDVYTTGSTMREAVGVLKESGIKEVFQLTITR